MKKRDLIISIAVVLVLSAVVFSFVRLTGKSITSIETCWDSDLGQNYWTKGSVEGEYYSQINPFEKKSFFEEDVCKSKNTLLEYYCDSEENGVSSYKQSRRFICPEGCENGKCLGEQVEVPKRTTLLEKIKDFFVG